MSFNILLVDDDPEFREEFCESLEEYHILQAANGVEALKILAKPNEIELVILDVMMPGLRGTKVMQEMKKVAPNLGIIILTGYSSKDIAVEALKGKADDYVEKPVDIDKIKQIIERIMAERGGRGPAAAFSEDIRGKIERVKKFAEKNYDKKVGLEDAAELVCLSPKYLSRIFKQDIGMGFSAYRLGVKIQKAKEMLERTGYSIEQISDGLAYQNLESFIRIFKQYTGVTPTEYRAKKKTHPKPAMR